jgi:4-amino-4-deoxy-L-arabinose transferase-like glycosyltransferase
LGFAAEVLLVGGLVGLALAVREPSLLLTPSFPPVRVPILQALEVANGQAIPLADQSPYLGPLFIYLLAAVYKLFGPSLEATQAVPWLLGSLTVLPTYLLGRELGGRVAGLLAAALLVTSPAHIVITSHVAWVHSLTPLLAVTTLWLLARARCRSAGFALAAAGLCAGLALQSHPTVAPLLVGAVGATLWQRQDWLRTRWVALALALALLGYSPLLVNTVLTRFVVVADIQGKQARYLDAEVDAGEDPDHGVYANNLQLLAISLVRLTAGELEDGKSPAEYAQDPRVVVYPVLGLAGLVWLARRGQPVLLLALLPAILLPPLFNGQYKPILAGRYLMPLVPVLFVGIGLGLVTLARGLDARPWGLARRGLLAMLALLLITRPLPLLQDFYAQSRDDGGDNTLALRALEQLKAARRGDEVVVLDPRLIEVKAVGGGSAANSLGWLLAVSGIPSLAYDGNSRGITGYLAVLQRDTADIVDNQVLLNPLDGRRSNGRDHANFRAYRVAAPRGYLRPRGAWSCSAWKPCASAPEAAYNGGGDSDGSST